MAQHGIRESGLYQLNHLRGSGAPHIENPDWSSEPLRAVRFSAPVVYWYFLNRVHVFHGIITHLCAFAFPSNTQIL